MEIKKIIVLSPSIFLSCEPGDIGLHLDIEDEDSEIEFDSLETIVEQTVTEYNLLDESPNRIPILTGWRDAFLQYADIVQKRIDELK